MFLCLNIILARDETKLRHDHYWRYWCNVCNGHALCSCRIDLLNSRAILTLLLITVKIKHEIESLHYQRESNGKKNNSLIYYCSCSPILSNCILANARFQWINKKWAAIYREHKEWMKIQSIPYNHTILFVHKLYWSCSLSGLINVNLNTNIKNRQ